MIRKVILLISIALPAEASGVFSCIEIERVSLAAEGSMRPTYGGRTLNFRWAENSLSGDGVFYHDAYSISTLGEDGFRAFAENSYRSDLFRFENGILFHAAIVKYGREPSIQSQLFECDEVVEF
jgi:hypothetical protein